MPFWKRAVIPHEPEYRGTGMKLVIVFCLVVVFSLAGSSFGVITGLTPGIHVNMVAFFLILLSPWLVSLILHDLSLTDDLLMANVLISLLIISTSIVHSFVDFIPSIFLGAPDEETALSVLPGHKMLLEGRGYRAIVLSVKSSFVAILFSFLLMVPFGFLVPEPVNVYGVMKKNIFWLLFFISSFLILSERRGLPGTMLKHSQVAFVCKGWPKLLALFVFLLSGVLGFLITGIVLSGFGGTKGSPLFPALTGLFGIPTLLFSLRASPEIPEQRIRCDGEKFIPDAAFLRNSLKGTLAGSVVGFLPGVSSSHAAVISTFSLGKKGHRVNEDEDFIVSLSSINTANAFFCLVALFLIQRSRNGATLAIGKLITVREWSGVPPAEMYLLLMGILVSSVFGLFVTLSLGKRIAVRIHTVSYERIVFWVLVFVVSLVGILTGLCGLLILGVSTILGLLPPVLGVRRSHLMGVLLLPVLAYFSPW